MPHSRRTRFRRWVYDRLPKWLRERDFEVFAAILCIVSGVPLAFGEVTSRAVEAQLNEFFVRGWGGALTLGGFLTILGIVKSITNSAEKIDMLLVWRRTEAYGLTILSYSAYIFALTILLWDWRVTFASACITLAFAMTCHSREIAVQLEIIDFRLGLGLARERQ